VKPRLSTNCIRIIIVLVISHIDEVRSVLAPVRHASRIIGFVPTMGALHAGHLRLIDEAAKTSDSVVVSIFVNPPQFTEQQDYQAYPRQIETDMALCRSHGVDVLFAPAIEEVYPQPNCAWIEVASVSEQLCGKFRPGHFRGVATVVMKLFQMVQPDRAYFGEKDAQQLSVIRRMVRDLNVPVAIVGVPTVRESDGLAISSRNARLSDTERAIAPALYRALQCAAQQIQAGTTSPEDVKRAAMAVLEAEPRIEVEYFEIVDPEEMQAVPVVRGTVRIAAAIRLGPVRLIDNILVSRPELNLIE
jgi:pantoate--beta-alanine ligase